MKTKYSKRQIIGLEELIRFKWFGEKKSVAKIADDFNISTETAKKWLIFFDIYKIKTKKAKKIRIVNSIWKQLRQKVIHKFNKKCCECGNSGNQVHHIVPVCVDQSKQLDENNLILLCKECHIKKHPDLKNIINHLRN